LHEILELACQSSAQLAHILYQTSRDSLELFLAIIPLRFCDVLETVPRMGALFYNDCMYIAHNLTILAHAHHQGLARAEPALQGCVGYIDFLPRFRAAGDKCLTKHVEEQQNTLTELISKIHVTTTEPNDTGKSNSSLIVYNNDEAAIVVVRHFDRLRGQWQEILQEPVYDRILGYLIEGVVRKIMEPALQADCISVSAASQIAKLMKTLQDMRAVMRVTDDDSISVVVGSWMKFLALQQLLEYNLTDIAEALQKRKFSSFTANELSNLVKALFEESPRRLNMLSAITQMSQ
jgi:hypothetical protein